MEERKNAGYTITDSIHIGKTEFVIGENHTKYGTMYVTWECSGKDNYFWGHYMNDRQAAERDLLERVHLQLELNMQMSESTPKRREHER